MASRFYKIIFKYYLFLLKQLSQNDSDIYPQEQKYFKAFVTKDSFKDGLDKENKFIAIFYRHKSRKVLVAILLKAELYNNSDISNSIL